MFNNRMLAVAAVFALAVPALGAAAPIVVPPATEQLVEGHTVFTVIEVFNNTTTIRAEFAAAVAVLVREYDQSARATRFPGVLWFNDQYLTNPSAGDQYGQNFRYPCGGAVMAVNAGDADPRVIIANVGSSSSSDLITSYEGITKPPVAEGTGVPGNYSWVNVTTDQGTPTANSDTVVTSLAGENLGEMFDYQESYLITDPNDHIWIIDKYKMYTRIGTSTISAPGGTQQVYTSPVWVVNMLGSPAFIPDDGLVSCGPYNDLVSQVYGYYAPAQASGADVSDADEAAGAAWDGVTQSDTPPVFPWPRQDTPPAGYAEPGRNGYCYNGNYDGDDDGAADCTATSTSPVQPIRLYNALLYFKLADLTDAGTPRDHSTFGTDTNGCQVGTEWECPGDNDDAEGNSHPFHPTPGAAAGTPGGRNPANTAHTDTPANNCPVPFSYGTEETNHGGSAAVDAGLPAYCDNLHATRNVDIYFSPAGRPFVPLIRNFVITDTQGKEAAFHDPTHHNP